MIQSSDQLFNYGASIPHYLKTAWNLPGEGKGAEMITLEID